MNKSATTAPRRKRNWSFIRKPVSSRRLAMESLLTTAAIIMLGALLFSYKEQPADTGRRYNPELTLLESGTQMDDFIKLRDPAMLFTAPAAESLTPTVNSRQITERAGQHTIAPPAMAIPQPAKFQLLTNDLPQTGNDYLRSILPGKVEPAIPPPGRQAVILNANGQAVVRFDVMELKDRRQKQTTVLSVQASGHLVRTSLIRSCGDLRLDRQAETALRNHRLPAGVYTVIWNNPGSSTPAMGGARL